jgi:ribosomal protein S18 acetylase RimI-like enzyme
MPEFRGRGCGRFIVRGLQEIAGASGVPLRLHVEKSSVAQAFYEALGFVIAGDESLRYLLRWTSSADTIR